MLRIATPIFCAVWLVASPRLLQAQTSCYLDQTVLAKQVMGLTVAPDRTIYYADYSGATVGILDLQHNRLSPILSGLNHPSSIEAAGNKVYFTELGTDAGHYHDGSLSFFEPGTGTRTLMATGLEYPVSLFVDAADNVYVLEAAGSSTSYGGQNRLLKFAPGSTQASVVIPYVPSPAAVVVDSQGRVIIGSYGNSIPGENGSLLSYAAGSTNPVTVVGGLPAVNDLILDGDDNLYLAGSGSDGGAMLGIALVPSGSSDVIPLKTGFRVRCLAVDAIGRIQYSTTSILGSIGQLTPCPGPPLSLTLTTPASNATFLLPTNVVLTATVSDSVGLVTNVTFFAGPRELGQVVGPPFSFEWTNPPPGVHILSAVAGDSAGNWGFSSLVNILVISTSNSPVHYVNPASPNPTPPYSTWDTAAETIQEAVDAAVAGDEIVVTNGIYTTGGVVGSARVTVTKRISLRSVNGPQFTEIRGPGRCVTLPAGAGLSGFTLANGSTPTGLIFDGNGNPINPDKYSGGGVFCASTTTIVSNCVLVGNSATYAGGGAYGGTLINCTLTNNTAGWGGGAASRRGLSPGCKLINCTLSGNRASDSGGGSYGTGGASSCVLSQCTLTNNSAGVDGSAARNCTLNACALLRNVGSAARDCTLNNCLLNGNSGEGSRYGTLNNCTLSGNYIGAYGGRLNNCIVYGNSIESAGGSVLYFCCTRSLPASGLGNVTNLDACIDGGNNTYATSATDFAGRPRIVGGAVDIGAYEFQGPFNDWLRQYGLSTNGVADFADWDADGANNWQEWIARTDPTNALSALRLLAPTQSGLGMEVTWQSASGRLYSLERSTNLNAKPAFLTLATDLVGQAGTTTYLDPEANGPGPYFYRVEVQPDSRPYAYILNGGAISITGYNGPGGVVTIPASINGLPVTSIGNYAFYLKTTLTSVTIPGGVTNIGVGAFFNCSSLTNVTIPDSVTAIGDNAFASCYGLTSITPPSGVSFIGNRTFQSCFNLTNILIPGGVTQIGEYAFSGCSSLTSITLPSSVVDIGVGAFSSCSKLSNVTIPDSVSDLGDSVFAYCTGLTNIAIGDGVTNIGYQLFAGCSLLANVTIPDSVTGIGWAAFTNCTSLTSINLGTSVSYIGDQAFASCRNLSRIAIPDSVTSIGNWTFSSCEGLTNISIGDGVVSIGDYALFYCSKLTSVTIPDGVTDIGKGAFEGCSSLTNIAIGQSVTNIGDNAFSQCYNLQTINVDVRNQAYSSSDGVLFDENQTTLLKFPTGRAGDYAMPDSVVNIAQSAFSLCTGLTNITFGNRVTSVGQAAFYYCTALTSITIPSSVSHIGDSAFYYCSSLATAQFYGNAPTLGGSYVFAAPFSQLNITIYYLPGTTGWGTTYGSRPTARWVLPQPLILSLSPYFGVLANQFGFRVSWATNIPVVVEASTDLAAANWSPVSTNNLVDGWFYFSDPQWTNYPGRFYRVRSQ